MNLLLLAVGVLLDTKVWVITPQHQDKQELLLQQIISPIRMPLVLLMILYLLVLVLLEEAFFENLL